jgi:hypothetical protein
MRIFWHGGGLHIHPETEREGRMLVELVEHLKFEKPPEMLYRTSSGTSSCCEDLFNSVGANHEISPSRNAGEAGNKNAVVSIHKLR